MEHLVKILDWAQVPESLLLTTEAEIKNHFINESPYNSIGMYRITDSRLINFLQPNFEFDLYESCCFYQIISEGFPVHIDQRRATVYNYILHPGGPEVFTVWYEPDKITERYKIRIPEKTWHRLDVSSPHTIVGPQTRKRLALSVFEEIK